MESFGKANNTFVKYFPSSTLMFFNVGVKGEGLYNLLSEIRNSAIQYLLLKQTK